MEVGRVIGKLFDTANYVCSLYACSFKLLLVFWLQNQQQQSDHFMTESTISQGKRISNPIDTVVLGFIQSTKKFKNTILSQCAGLTFWSLCGQKSEKAV